MLDYTNNNAEYSWEAWADPYESIREILHPSFESASPEEIEAAVLEVFGDVDIEDLEGFLDDVKNFGRQVIQRAPSILTGAATGAATGGAAASVVPGLGTAVGAVLGGLLGAGSALAGRSRSGATPPTPNAGSPAGPARAAQQPGPSAGSQTPAKTNPSAAALIALLMRPEVLQALVSLAAGTKGRRTVPVGEYEVPTELFLTTIREVAEEAEQIHLTTELESVATEELMDTPPSEQAVALIELLADTEMVLNDDFEEDALEMNLETLYPDGLVESEIEAELAWLES